MARRRADRVVLRSCKNENGDIDRLLGPFGSVRTETAIEQITVGTHHYRALSPSSELVDVVAREGRTGRFVYANWDGTGRNNLDDLPDCDHHDH